MDSSITKIPIKNPEENQYLSWIINGTKKYEGRTRNKIKDWNLSVGKLIQLFDEDNPCTYVICEITELLYFDDFGQAFDTLGEILIHNRTKNEVIRLYNGFYESKKYEDGITSDYIKNRKVVAIGLNVIVSIS